MDRSQWSAAAITDEYQGLGSQEDVVASHKSHHHYHHHQQDENQTKEGGGGRGFCPLLIPT